MTRKYSENQHEIYLRRTRQIGRVWAEEFGREPELYSAHYWDLFTGLYENRNRHVKKTEAFGFIQFASPMTARKVVDTAVTLGYVEEMDNPEDARSKLVRMAPKLKERLSRVLDAAIDTLREELKEIDQVGRLRR